MVHAPIVVYAPNPIHMTPTITITTIEEVLGVPWAKSLEPSFFSLLLHAVQDVVRSEDRDIWHKI